MKIEIRQHKFNLIMGTFGENAVRSFGHSIKSSTRDQFVNATTFPIGFGRFVGFIYIENKWESRTSKIYSPNIKIEISWEKRK